MIWAIYHAGHRHEVRVLRASDYGVLAALLAVSLAGARRLVPCGLQRWEAVPGAEDGLVEAYRATVVVSAEVAA